MQPVIEVEGKEYEWAPTRSAPSTSSPLPELSQVLSGFPSDEYKSAIDFGAGRGRNLPPLCKFFDEVTAVEHESLIPILRSTLDDHSLSNCTLVKSENFTGSEHDTDVVFMVYVLHILPFKEMRQSIIRDLRCALRPGGKVVIVVPGSDPKYRNDTLKNATNYKDGIAILYDNQTYTFYKDYTPDELDSFLEECGLVVTSLIGGDHKYIRVTADVDDTADD